MALDPRRAVANALIHCYMFIIPMTGDIQWEPGIMEKFSLMSASYSVTQTNRNIKGTDINEGLVYILVTWDTNLQQP